MKHQISKKLLLDTSPKNVFLNHQFCAVSELLFYSVFLKFRLRMKRFWYVNSVDEDR